MKKILSLILAASMVFALAITSYAADKPEAVEISGTYKIRLSTPTGGKHQQNYTMELFKSTIEEITNGAITVELYPVNQWGDATTSITDCQNGDLEGVLIPSSYFATVAPAIAILDLPFIFEPDGTAAAKAQQILSAGTSLDEYLYNKGFKVGGYLLGGDQIMLTKFPIETIDDFKGHKIWTLPSKTLQDSLAAYGASPAVGQPGEVAQNLQNNTIEGLLNDCTFWVSNSLQDSAQCIEYFPAGAFVNCFFFSADWYDSLPEDVQEVVSAVATYATEEEVTYMTQYVQEAMDTLTEAGCTIYYASDELLADMKAATESLHEAYKSTDSDCAALYDEFTAKVAELQ